MTTTLLVLRDRLQTNLGDKNQVYAAYYTDAINEAIREIYPSLFRHLDDRTLITNNILPNAHFEDWSQTTYPDHYRVSVVTAVEDTTYIRGGKKSAKVTRAGTDGYMYISQVEYPRLLDLMDRTIDFKCWVWASTASQAYIEIYTKQADGTEQTTLISSAHSGGSEFELLELEDQTLNDDLTDIQLRFHVKTSDGSVYFDNARVNGKSLNELLLPLDLQNGSLRQVHMQSSGYSDDPCDDLNPKFSELFDWYIADDGTYRYLRFPYTLSSDYLLRLVGYCPLETLSADTDTISLDGERVNLLIAYAKYKAYQMVEGTPASKDVRRYQTASERAYGEYLRLLGRHRMVKPSVKIGVF